MAIDAQPLIAAIENGAATAPRICLDALSMWQRLRRRWLTQADEDAGVAARWLRSFWFDRCRQEGR